MSRGGDAAESGSSKKLPFLRALHLYGNLKWFLMALLPPKELLLC